MKNVYIKKALAGFSLIELLVVVAILAVLAAVIAPQFSNSSVEAKESALRSNLSSLRSAVELYYRDHGKYPSAVAATGATCPGTGLAGTGNINSEQAFIDQLTLFTNASGQACTTTDATYKYGPYLKDGIPTDPVTSSSAVALPGTPGDLNMSAAAATGGWLVDQVTGKVIVNNSSASSDGSTYDSW